MAERVVSTRVRVIPSPAGLREPAGQDPVSVADEEGLASIAFLAGVSPSNVAVSRYVNALNNSNYASTLRGAVS